VAVPQDAPRGAEGVRPQLGCLAVHARICRRNPPVTPASTNTLIICS
jgi:hypothetical protein